MSCTETSGEFPAVRLDCDRKGCTVTHLVTDRDGSEACKRHLLSAGWRLYRGKVLCPRHAAQIERRLRRFA